MLLRVLTVAAATVAALDARRQVTAVVDVPLPALAAVAIPHRAAADRTAVADPRVAAVDPRMVAAVAADMGGNTALDSFHAA